MNLRGLEEETYITFGNKTRGRPKALETSA
jgi:hypothetical protein